VRALDGLGWKPMSDFLTHGDEPGAAHVTPEELEYLRAAYHQQVRYVDFWIGVLIRQLENWKLRENTLVALTSDHGESFLEHGHLHHISHLYNENLPWIVANPRLFAQPRRLSHPVEQIDLAPTLLSLLGLPIPAAMQGLDQSLPEGQVRDVYSEGEALNAFKLQSAARSCIVTPADRGRPRVELFDLAADPGESADLASARPDEAQQCAAAVLRRYRENLRRPDRRRDVPATLDEESLRQLEALGYLN
jgi:arylsulfatase A-like enzyme